MAPKITVGMAHCDDFEGLWATVQSVFLHNTWNDPEDVEIVIVDTSPIGSEHRRLVADFVRKGGGIAEGTRTRNLKLVDMAGFAGTTLSFVDYVKEFPYFADEVLPRLKKAGIR